MAISTKVRTLFKSVSTTLQDISPQFTRWPEQEMVIVANYGQMALAKYLPQAGSRIDAIKLQAGTRQDLTKVLAANIKPGDGSAAADAFGITLLDIVRNMGADGATPGRIVRICDQDTKDSNDPDWHTRTGAVVREFIFDKAMPKVFWVVPGVPVGGNVWVDINWLAEPTRIPDGGLPGAEVYAADGASNVLLGINDQFVEDLHNYMVGMLLLKGSKNTENVAKAQLHAGLFTQSLNAQVTVLTGVNPNLKQLPGAAELGAA